MFSPRASPYTPTSRSTQNKRVSSLFTPQRKGSPFPSTAGNKSHSRRSLVQTSQLLEETHSHRVEKYGTPLPVLITEILTFTDRNTEISVKLDPTGWAWLVGGRKLFVWRYKAGTSGRNVLCKELTLPPSDLAHNADRVCVIPRDDDAQSAACIAVSPEGVVRYWPNIAYEASSVEISAELKGEECKCVVYFPPFGCLLGTTTSSLVMLTPVPGQNKISYHPLKAAQGMFSGFGRRMSSLIFGSEPGHTSGASLQALVPGEMGDDERPFYVLSGMHLQKWTVQDGNSERLLYQIDAERMFRENLARKVWDKDSFQLTELKTWLLDMQPTEDGVTILGAGADLEANPTVHYAIVNICTMTSSTPSAPTSFTVLDFKQQYEENLEYELFSYQLSPLDGDEIFIYDDQKIIICSASGTAVEELNPPGGKIIGAGVTDSEALFFSIVQGLFSVSSSHKQDASMLDEFGEESFANGDMSSLAPSSSQLHDMSISEDKPARLKAAFIMTCKGNMKEADELVHELFPMTIVTGKGVSSEIDKLVTKLSLDLIDDYPASDPRWAESKRLDTVQSTTSVIILQQLKDKRRAHEFIINFLKKVNLWDRLNVIPVRDGVMSTKWLLCEHVEKLEAAIILRELHNQHGIVIDPAIKKVLMYREDLGLSASLTHHDLFYREVSKIHELFEALLEFEKEVLSREIPSSEAVNFIQSVNAVMEGMLQGALQYRKSKGIMFMPNATEQAVQPEYISWTSTGGKTGLRTILREQYSVTLEMGTPRCGTKEVDMQGILFQQLLFLVDVLLDGYTHQLLSLRQGNQDRYDQLREEFEQEKHHLILPFLEYKQYEAAASLAEKYLDFEILVQLCEKTRNQEKIQKYTEQFANQGFSDFLFNWYMKEGKRGKMLSQPVSKEQDLSRFLQADHLHYLKWLHDINSNKFKEAYFTLMHLGRHETEILARKKTLLSLCKLAALASEDFDEEMESSIQEIDEEHELILHQELLPADLVQGLNMEPEHMRVLEPSELVRLYVSDENVSATEYDFKKALDLLNFMAKGESGDNLETLRMHIWCQAILKEKTIWTRNPVGDPLDSIKDTVFLKTVALAFREGWNPQSFLPEHKQLLRFPELGELRENQNLHFFLAAAYEQILSVLK
ncbi:hypothetical protein ACJMK2_037949 [Sinanodonta woodiana]|uniref:Nuclear pore complex protein Nup133 n=1 Tax=Sinanodonta woodiana TaxID=1069815 RepID=A0ABD3WMF6_SINWO